MEKEIKVVFLKAAEAFVEEIDEKTRIKLFKVLRLIKARIFGEWFKKMPGSDGIYEIRVDYNGKYYRLFTFWDESPEGNALIVATNGIIKKTNKTPKREIENAMNIKKIYFENKRVK